MEGFWEGGAVVVVGCEVGFVIRLDGRDEIIAR